ncbi:hypothetical protein QBC40DRAFT_216414 [Triangularia verruculosa]|uniref:Uncharacterized protein n=1 Tax=Triangularia verruculosa TaxID=2587418 RepID=A0AAN7B192_9PEZI|nr:hypothetical protein QBC40DRAFT_216414 [Triangularia verruculosa]
MDNNDNNDNSHQHYRTTGTRRIPSWLNAIPSEAGGGSDATSRTGASMASHHQPGPPPPYSLQGHQQPEKQAFPQQQDEKSTSPPKMKARQHYNPPAQQLYSETSLASSDPLHQFQTSPRAVTSTQPTSTQPQSSQQHSLPPLFPQPNYQVPPTKTPSPPSPAKSQSVLEPLRQEIFGNFSSNCVTCIFMPSATPTPMQCGRCQMIRSYINESYHTYRFLHSYLLPISEVFNYEEMLAYLNEVIIERVLAAEGKGNVGKEKIFPTMDDFGAVVVKAKRRKQFFGGVVVPDGKGAKGGNGRVVGQWGMVRDGTVPVPRGEAGQASSSGRRRGGGVRMGG